MPGCQPGRCRMVDAGTSACALCTEPEGADGQQEDKEVRGGSEKR